MHGNVTILSALLLSVQQFYFSKNVYLVYSDFCHEEDGFNFLRFYKSICLKKFTPTAAIHVGVVRKTFADMDDNKITIDSPMVVFLTDDEFTRSKLNEILSGKHMKYAIWLLFKQRDVSNEEFFKDIYIPFNIEFLVVDPILDGVEEAVINEVYNTGPQRASKIKFFGRWNLTNGFIDNLLPIHMRRPDLDGLVMNITTVEMPAVTMLDNLIRPKKFIGGYIGSVWNALQEKLNFTSRITVPVDNEYGAKMGAGENHWNGMIGMVIRKEVDVAVCDITQTPDRMDVISFSSPILFAKDVLVFKKSMHEEIRWLGFLLPFHYNIWFCLIGNVILMATALYIFEELHRRISYRKRHQNSTRFCDAFLNVAKSYMQQGPDTVFTFEPTKIIFFLLYATAIVILSSYSAALVSFLTVEIYTKPFNSLEDFAKVGTSYTLGTTLNSADWHLFNGRSNAVLKHIRENMMESVALQSRTYAIGMQRVCSDTKFVFFMDSSFFYALEDIAPCKLEIVLTNIWTSASLAFPKNSPYQSIINYNLNNLLDGGITDRFKKMAKLSRQPKMKTQSTWTSMKMIDIFPLLVGLIIAIIISLIILFFEIQIKKYTSYKSKKIKFRE